MEVNTDHFPSIQAWMAYIFSQIGRDAQTYLKPCYAKELANAFKSDNEIVAHLASIYKDPYKV